MHVERKASANEQIYVFVHPLFEVQGAQQTGHAGISAQLRGSGSELVSQVKPGENALGILGIRRHHQELDAHPRPRSRAIGQRKDLAKGYLAHIEKEAERFAERAAMHKETPEHFRGIHTAKFECRHCKQSV